MKTKQFSQQQHPDAEPQFCSSERDLCSPQMRWAQLAQKHDAKKQNIGDASLDFLYGVRTTQIYCRPQCPSRLPRPENVLFFETPLQAQQAGYRPCKRCLPDRVNPTEHLDQAIATVCRFIDESTIPLTLGQLADLVHWSPFYLQRQFKQALGLSPKQYMIARRRQVAQQKLQSPAHSITEVSAQAGFESSSRFYQHVQQWLGMKPKQYKKGAQGQRIWWATAECNYGQVLVATTDKGICAILLGDEPSDLQMQLKQRFPAAQLQPGSTELSQHLSDVLCLLAEPTKKINLATDIQGTAFQQRVWQALSQTRCGQTISYAQLASQLGAPKAARAVASACAANPLAVAIPCHRVLRGDGELGGYRWGLPRKQKLLEQESRNRQS